MFPELPIYWVYILCFVVSTVISLYSVKKIIFIARKRKIFDIPDNIRKIHGGQIPSLGGIGIFISYMATALFFVPFTLKGWNYIIISSVILFFTGIYDDMMNMRPLKKLIAQLLAVSITVYFGDIRITSLYGFLGVGELPVAVSIGITIFTCTFFINVFNFIDGIDGLACMTTVLYTTVFGVFLAFYGSSVEATVTFTLAGATLGLLYYNYPPAKIYMGDTGSMLSGFSIFVLSLLFIHSSEKYPAAVGNNMQAGYPALLITIAVFFLPVFDALRVFTLRGSKGISPLIADRSHLHYYLLDAGLSHGKTAWLLVGINVLSILLCIGCLGAGLPAWLILSITALPTIIVSIAAGWGRE